MFVNCVKTLPLAPLVFVALKLPTVFAPFKVVPVAETVVNNPVVLNVPPVSRDALPAAVDVDRSCSGRDRGVNGDVARTSPSLQVGSCVSVKVSRDGFARWTGSTFRNSPSETDRVARRVVLLDAGSRQRAGIVHRRFRSRFAGC